MERIDSEMKQLYAELKTSDLTIEQKEKIETEIKKREEILAPIYHQVNTLFFIWIKAGVSITQSACDPLVFRLIVDKKGHFHSKLNLLKKLRCAEAFSNKMALRLTLPLAEGINNNKIHNCGLSVQAKIG